jgi:hypothetical protein
MNSREYLLELVEIARALHKKDMRLWEGLNSILQANANQLKGLNAEDRAGIRKEMDYIRRKHNREVYSQDDALKFQPWAQFTDAHGWTHIKNMRKHDNVPGERTE